MLKPRHTELEIAAKLAEADEMAARGVPHGEIAKSLGVSIMTYHRWRKARAGSLRLAGEAEQTGLIGQLRELQLENSRLRRLVTDLLLKNVELEDSDMMVPAREWGRSKRCPRVE